MISLPERARLLDAEMQLQRAWLELSLRDFTQHARQSPWSKLNLLKLGSLGASLLRHRTVWMALLTVVINLFQRNSRKGKS